MAVATVYITSRDPNPILAFINFIGFLRGIYDFGEQV
jgi:hypothetical protein